MDQESKPIIVVASILKPVDDIRMFGKIGLSLKNTGRYAIHSIGYPSANHSQPAENLHPLWRFRRISFGRMLAPLRVLIILFRLKPQLLIITTHELLFVAALAKLMLGCKVVYDIQENYYLNISHTPAFPVLFRPLIAGYVRLKERLSATFIDHYFLAEKAYKDEMKLNNNVTILENKALRPHAAIQRTVPSEGLRLLFSGTLAETTGVFLAIQLAEALHSVDVNTTLHIIGYCSREDERYRLNELIRERSYIKLTGGTQLVSHDEILKAIENSDLGIIAYPFNISTSSSIPTKLYEYLAYELPILLIDHDPWKKICERYNAAIVFDPSHFNGNTILNNYKKTSFYNSKPTSVYWDSEEQKLIATTENLI